MLVPVKYPGKEWSLEHRPPTRRASTRPGLSGRRRAHGPRSFVKRPTEQFKPLPFRSRVAGVLAAVAGFLNIGRRKAA